MELLGIIAAMVIVRALANVFEDVWATVKNQPNQRMKRAKARREQDTPIRDQLWGWLGDVLADAREESARRREERRERQAEARRQRDRELHPTVDAEYTIDPDPEEGDPRNDPDKPDVWDLDTPDPINECRYGADVEKENCGWASCPVHGHLNRTKPELTPDPEPETNGTNPYAHHDNYGGAPNMSADAARGLDPAINYCDQMQGWSANHGPAGNEGFVNGLSNSGVGEDGGVAAVRLAQQKMAEASAAWGAAKQKLADSNKAVQEAYRRSQGAGDKGFQTTGS